VSHVIAGMGERSRRNRRHSCRLIRRLRRVEDGSTRYECRVADWTLGKRVLSRCGNKSVRPYAAAEPPRGLSTEPVQSAGRPSKISRVFFASTPPTYWPIEPSLRTTRWQGTTTGMGLVAHAVPTARTAFGLPAASAMAA
jgi:hypothetical protein